MTFTEHTSAASLNGVHHLHFVFNDEGDWAGVYHNGKLEYEGHTIPDDVYIDIITKFAECGDKPYHRRVTSQYDVDLSAWGRCPHHLSNLAGWRPTPSGWSGSYIRKDDSRLPKGEA